MAQEITATMTSLRPAEELRRPDRHGQLPHIILTLYPDRPLDQLDSADILEMNWTGVETAMRDALVRIEHEGDLASSTLHETIQLIALALKRLEIEDAEQRRALVSGASPGLGIWLIALTPGTYGTRARLLIAGRRRLKKKIVEFERIRNRIFNRRIELAKAVDARVGAMLMRESEEYRALREKFSQGEAVRDTAGTILGEFGELEKVQQSLARNNDHGWESVRVNQERKRQILEKMPAFIAFVAGHTGKKVENAAAAEVCLRQLVADLTVQAAPARLEMGAMREERKRELYSRAAAVVGR